MLCQNARACVCAGGGWGNIIEKVDRDLKQMSWGRDCSSTFSPKRWTSATARRISPNLGGNAPFCSAYHRVDTVFSRGLMAMLTSYKYSSTRLSMPMPQIHLLMSSTDSGFTLTSDCFANAATILELLISMPRCFSAFTNAWTCRINSPKLKKCQCFGCCSYIGQSTLHRSLIYWASESSTCGQS